MKGLQIGDFGHFIFIIEYHGMTYKNDMEGLEVTDMDHHNVWLTGMDGDEYNVMKKNITKFEKQDKSKEK